jgi:hypothetical protein
MPATKTRPGLTGVVPLGWEPSDEELSQAIEETIEAEKIRKRPVWAVLPG